MAGGGGFEPPWWAFATSPPGKQPGASANSATPHYSLIFSSGAGAFIASNVVQFASLPITSIQHMPSSRIAALLLITICQSGLIIVSLVWYISAPLLSEYNTLSLICQIFSGHFLSGSVYKFTFWNLGKFDIHRECIWALTLPIVGLWDIYPGGRGVGGGPPKCLISLGFYCSMLSHILVTVVILLTKHLHVYNSCYT